MLKDKTIRGANSANLALGVSSALVSMLLFSTMDATIKWLGGDYPVHQIMFFRCSLAFVPIFILLYRAGGIAALGTRQPLLHGVRSLLGLVAMGCAFYGFTTLPLADASSVFYTAPLLAVAFSVPILGEKVGVRRWVAVTIGLMGVMIIVRPGGNVFNLGGVAMLVAAVAVGVTSNVIRKLNQTDQAICITFYFTLSGAIVTSVACLWLGWNTPSGYDFFLLVCVGLLGGSAQYTLTLSFRYAQVGIIAPLKYLSIVVGGLLGFIIWDETPDGLTVFGIMIIIASGLYSMHRETQLARDRDYMDSGAFPRTIEYKNTNNYD